MNTATTPLDSALNRTRILLDAARRTEERSRRNGWDTDSSSSVFPGRDLIDALLDIRGLLDGQEDDGACRIVDSALREHGRRPGASTTREVRDLCEQLLKALGDDRS
jgi:hypothetical protein